MSNAVTEQQSREQTFSKGPPLWMENPTTIPDQYVLLEEFRPHFPVSIEYKGEAPGSKDSSSQADLSCSLVILHSSSTFTILEQQTTDWTKSSTVNATKPEALTEELKRIFFAAREEVFEDGMDSVFSRRLVMFMKRYSRLGIDVLSELLILEHVNAEVAGEALRHVGYFEHSETHIPRRRLLEHCLFGSSAKIRDGAILGIAAMDDPKSIPFVEQAVERERISGLKEDIMDVLDQLHETLAEV